MDTARFHPGGGGVLRIEERLERRVSAARLETGGDANAGQKSAVAQALSFTLEGRPIDVIEHLGDDCVIVPAIVPRAARNKIGEFLLMDEIAPPYLDTVKAKRGRHPIHRGLDSVIGWRLAEATYSFLHRLVRSNRLSVILDALNLIGADDGADR